MNAPKISTIMTYKLMPAASVTRLSKKVYFLKIVSYMHAIPNHNNTCTIFHDYRSSGLRVKA